MCIRDSAHPAAAVSGAVHLFIVDYHRHAVSAQMHVQLNPVAACFPRLLKGCLLYTSVCEIAAAEGSLVLPICAKIEEDIADMSKEDKQLFLDELGLESSGLDRLIQKGYEPVSYTHLDVYKRQPFNPLIFLLPPRKEEKTGRQNGKK